MSEFNKLVLDEDGLIVGNRQIDTSQGGVYFSGNAQFATTVTIGGELRCTDDIIAFYTSDEKYKTNINPIENATEKVTAIGAKTFEWKEEYLNFHPYTEKKDFGVIAQDVLNVFPQAVHERPDGSLSVDYVKLGVLAFQAIKEMDERLNKLEQNNHHH